MDDQEPRERLVAALPDPQDPTDLKVPLDVTDLLEPREKPDREVLKVVVEMLDHPD